MLKKIFIALCTLFVISVWAGDAIESYENNSVGKIEVLIENQINGTSFDSKPILARLKTKVNDPFSQTIFDGDLKTLSDEFDKVMPTLSLENGKVSISLKIWIRSTIHQITWKGNHQITNSKLQKELGIKIGTIFNRYLFNQALNKVKELYVKEGFFESQIDFEAIPIEGKNEVNIVVKVSEGRSGKVRSISLKGFSKDEEKQIKELMYTKSYFFLTSWVTGTGLLRDEVLEQDRLSIINLLQNEGYADAKITINLVDEKNGVNIVIIADKGVIYHIGAVSYTGNHIIENSDVDKVISLKSGDLFSIDKIRDCSQAIKDLYGHKGYIEAEVSYDTILAENAPIYNIVFNIEEGKLFKIGIIRIIGNSHTQSRVLLRESLLVPGETFDSRKLKATQERLSQIGYFKNVNVYAVRSSEESAEDTYRDVYIEVEEATTGHGALSVGASSLNDVYGSVDVTETNFNWHGLFTMFRDGPSALRGGGEFLRLNATVGAKQNSFVLSWLDPYFRDTPWRVGFEVSKTFNHLQSKDYKISTYGGSLSASYPINNYWVYGSRYRARHSTTYFHKRHGHNHDRRLLGKDGLISGLSSFFGFDSTNRAYKPTAGMRSTFSAEFVGIGGDFSFWKFEQLNTGYYPIWKKGTLKCVGNVQFIAPIWSTDTFDLPMSERFFLGGETTVRGYKPFILGPKLKDRKNDPIGGISSTLLSIEYSQEIVKVVDVFAFVDGGCISQKKFAIPKINASYGFGLRLEISPRTPMMIGMGFPINPDRKSDVRKFFFSMGAQF